MSMPSDATPDITEAMAAEPRFPGERLLTQFTPLQRGWAAAALITFVGVAYLGPALTRWTARKSRAQRFKEDTADRTRQLRRHAAKEGSKARKKVRRLGGGTIWR